MMDSTDNNQNIIDEAVQQFLNAKMQGQEPDLNEFVKKYPGYEHQIRKKIKKIQRIDGLFDCLMKADESDYNEPIAENDLIGKKLGDFEILSKIGAGGMGAVFLARQISLDREVALKVISNISGSCKTSLERFKREKNVLADISHPNIVPIYDYDEQGPYSYFAMEYVQGISLDKVLAGIKNAPPDEKASDVMRKCLAAQTNIYKESAGSAKGSKGGIIDTEYIVAISRIIISIANALDFAHKKGILHRDVTPSNILISSDGTPKLVDFGLAKAESQQTVTVTGEFFGKPSYVSPEQIRKPETVDCRSDVYSLAATYYECLTLHAPFEGNTINETLTQVISREAIPPKKYCPRLSSDFNTVLLHALEKLQDDRYQNSNEFAKDIQNVLDFKLITAKKPSITHRAYRTLRRSPLKITAISAIILVVVLIYLLGSTYLQQKNMAYARKMSGIGQQKFAEGRPQEAVSYLEKSLKAEAGSAEIYTRLGDCFLTLQQYGKAIDGYKNAIKLNPNFAEAYHGLAITYGNLNRDEEAIEAYKKAIEKGPKSTTFYRSLASFYAFRCRPEESRKCYEQIVAITHGIEPAGRYMHNYDLGIAYNKLGRHLEAIATLNEAIIINPDLSFAYYILGDSYEKLGDRERTVAAFGESINAYKRTFKLDPNNFDGYVWLADSYERLGRYEEAVETYKQAIEINPNDPRNYTYIGHVYKNMSLYENAIEAYKKSIEINPNFDHSRAYLYLATVYEKLGRYEEALEPTKYYYMGNLNDIDAYLCYAQINQKLGRYEEAIDICKKGLKIDPNDYNIYYDLGFNYLLVAQYQYAIEAFRRSLALNPQQGLCYMSIGQAFHKLEQYEDAIKAYKRAIEIDPTSATNAYCFIGFIYQQMEKFGEAIESYKQAISNDPNDPNSLNNLAWLYSTCPDQQFRDGKEAVRLAQKACELSGYDNMFRVASLAAAYAECGDFDKAVEYQEKAIELADDNNVKTEYENRLAFYKAKKPWRE
jgi:tetratricopeptide (TPR) repeat protein